MIGDEGNEEGSTPSSRITLNAEAPAPREANLPSPATTPQPADLIDKATRLAPIVLTGIAMITVTAWLMGGQRPSPPDAPINNDSTAKIVMQAIDGAARICKLFEQTSTNRKIDVRVLRELIGAGGSTEETAIKSAYDLSLSENGRLTVDSKTRDCMVTETDKLLARMLVPGVKIAQTSEVAMTTDGEPLRGFIYYEEQNGQMTEDGVFRVIGSQQLPVYSRLTVGSILRATSTARVRQEATKASDFLGQFQAGQCARIERDANAPLSKLTSASSGGWIFAQAIACPKT